MVMLSLVIPTSFDLGRLIPTGGVNITFFTDACPTGWTEYTTLRGRYPVGVPSGGTLEATVGTALSNSENRPVGQHTHVFTGDAHSHVLVINDDPSGNNVIPAAGVNGPQNGATETTIATGTNATSGGVADTNAPYVQLIACTKD